MNFTTFCYLIFSSFCKTFFLPTTFTQTHTHTHTHDPRPLPTTHDPRHLATLVEMGKVFPQMGKWARQGHTAFTNLNFKPFLDTPIRRGIISSGTRSFLTVTETLAGTLVGFKKHLTASIGTVELRILTRGCLQSVTDQYNRTADRWRNSHLL